MQKQSNQCKHGQRTLNGDNEDYDDDYIPNIPHFTCVRQISIQFSQLLTNIDRCEKPVNLECDRFITLNSISIASADLHLTYDTDIFHKLQRY